MKALLRVMLIAAATIVLQQRGQAQDVMVPFDVESNIVTYNANMEKQLGLFPDVPDLLEARIWMSQDSVYTLEFSSGMGERFVRSRRTITREQVLDIQTRFAAGRRVKLQSIGLDQAGRPMLLWTSTLLGATYYGTALGLSVFGSSFGDDAATTAFPFLFAGGAGFALPYILTKNTTITRGDASLMRDALILGPATGWGLTALLLGENIANGDNYRLGFGLSMVTGVAGTLAAYKFSRSNNLSEGHANVISTTTIYGGVMGLCAAAMVGDITDLSAEVGVRLLSGLALAGSATGFVVGHSLGKAQPYTVGDATSYAITTALAGLLPLSAYAAFGTFDDFDATLLSGATILTTAAGMYLGDRGVKGRDYSADEAQYMGLGVAGGALAGLGVSIMVSASKSSPLIMLGGATAGFLAVRAGFSDDAQARASSMGSLDLQWNFNPAAPMMAKSLNGLAVPFIGLSGRF